MIEAALKQSCCLDGYSLPVSSWRTLEFAIKTMTLLSISGTKVDSIDLNPNTRYSIERIYNIALLQPGIVNQNERKVLVLNKAILTEIATTNRDQRKTSS